MGGRDKPDGAVYDSGAPTTEESSTPCNSLWIGCRLCDLRGQASEIPTPMVAIIQDIHSFNRYTLMAYKVPGTLVALRCTRRAGTQLHRAYNLAGPPCLASYFTVHWATDLMALPLFMTARPLDLMSVLIFNLLSSFS